MGRTMGVATAISLGVGAVFEVGGLMVMLALAPLVETGLWAVAKTVKWL
jgi:hypothetical protein